jgi:gamma-glutamyl hercynylcysteine S-oxide hydrolase
MCRHLAYLGPPAPLSWPLLEAPHALVVQAAAPRDMRGGGTINADGFGLGWFAGPGPGPRTEPVRYRRDVPIWSDAQLPRLAAATTSPGWLAAVRSATPGMPLLETACAPFAGGGWLFSLNGRIAGWPDAVAGLAARLPVTDLLTMEAPTDSVLVWALLRQRLAAGGDPAAAVAATVTEVAAAAPGSRLNLLLGDATTIVATTLTHSLSIRRDPDAVLVSSEPLDDDPAWRPVPDRSLVVATPQAVKISPLFQEGAP